MSFDAESAERLFNNKNECSPAVFRVGLECLAALAERDVEIARLLNNEDYFETEIRNLTDRAEAAEAEIARLTAERDEARAFAERYREALGFYADKRNWHRTNYKPDPAGASWEPALIETDGCGERARRALLVEHNEEKTP